MPSLAGRMKAIEGATEAATFHMNELHCQSSRAVRRCCAALVRNRTASRQGDSCAQGRPVHDQGLVVRACLVTGARGQFNRSQLEPSWARGGKQAYEVC